METKEKVRKVFATVLLVAILAIVLYALLPFFNALFGAVLLYFLFRPLYLHFHKNHIPKVWSALIVIIISLCVLIIPLGVGASLVISEVSSGFANPSTYIDKIHDINELLPFVDIMSFSDEIFSALVSFSKSMLLSTVDNVSRLLIQLTITYFVFYFMLIDSENLNEKMLTFLPFNEKNSKDLLKQFDTVTHSTIVTSGLIALMQGGLLGVGFLVLGIKGAFFWGFIGFLISFLPVVGIPLIWFPTAMVQFFSGNIFVGFAIFAWGAFLSTIDNFIRPYIQHKVGQIHPLITLIGVLSGLPIFGIMGIVIGPLLLSYTVSITQMYIEEFV